MPASVPPGTMIHRIGGAAIGNLGLKPAEAKLSPPGISVLLDGTAQNAADQMRAVFADTVQFARLHAQAESVGSSTVDSIRQTGFDVIAVPTTRLPNHGRIVHPLGTAGFTDENLTELAKVLIDTPTPRS
jgi:hypothetical protein